MSKQKKITTYNKNIADHGRHTAEEEKLTPDVRKTFKGATSVDATRPSQNPSKNLDGLTGTGPETVNDPSGAI